MKWLFCLLVACATLARAQVDPNRTIMVINGEEIKGAEYYRRLELVGGIGRMVGNRFVETPPGLLLLQRMVDERILLQLARSKGVAPTDVEVKEEIDRRIAESPKLLEHMQGLGYTREDLEREVRLEIAEFKVQTQGITITDLEVENFHRNNPTMFTTPKRYKLRVIVVATDVERQAVDADLAAGKDFADVAKARSLDLTKVSGGDMGAVPVDAMGPALAKAVETARIGAVTEWAQGESGFAKFLVVDVLPEEKAPLDARLKRDLRRRLMLDRGRVKNDLGKLLRELAAKAHVEVRQVYFNDAIRDYAKGPTGGS